MQRVREEDGEPDIHSGGLFHIVLGEWSLKTRDGRCSNNVAGSHCERLVALAGAGSRLAWKDEEGIVNRKAWGL